MKNDQHADRHQHDIHRRGDKGNVVSRGEENHEGGVDDQRGGQRCGPQVHHAEDADNHRNAHEKRDMRLGIGIAIGVKRQGPGGKPGRYHARQTMRTAQRGQNDRRSGWRPVYSAQPFACTDATDNREQRRDQQRQPHRSGSPMSERQRPGIDQQHEVHQRQLSGQRNVLGLQQPGVISRHRHQGTQGTR